MSALIVTMETSPQAVFDHLVSILKSREVKIQKTNKDLKDGTISIELSQSNWGVVASVQSWFWNAATEKKTIHSSGASSRAVKPKWVSHYVNSREYIIGFDLDRPVYKRLYSVQERQRMVDSMIKFVLNYCEEISFAKI